MVKQQNIENFINYQYVPFSRLQCFCRLLIIWSMGFIVAMIGHENRGWLTVICCISLLISCIFIMLLIRRNTTKKPRFICDGVFYAYISILFNIAAYRVIAFQTGANLLLFIIYLALLLICIFLFGVIAFINIANDRYGEQTKKQTAVVLPFVGGLSGMIVASLFLHQATQNTIVMCLSVVLLLLSFFTSIGSINLFKVRLAKKLGIE